MSKKLKRIKPSKKLILENIKSPKSENIKNTKFLINEFALPFIGGLPKEEIKKQLNGVKNEIHFVAASNICKDKLQNEVVSTVYLLGYAVNNKLIPLKKESVLLAIKKIIPEKYQELNIKALNLSYGN